FVGAIAGAALISACSQPSDSQQTAAQQQQQAADADAQGGRREGLGRRREDRHRRSLYGVSAELWRRRARVGGEPTHRRAQRTGPQSGGREGLGRRREGRHRRGLYGIYAKFAYETPVHANRFLVPIDFPLSCVDPRVIPPALAMLHLARFQEFKVPSTFSQVLFETVNKVIPDRYDGTLLTSGASGHQPSLSS